MKKFVCLVLVIVLIWSSTGIALAATNTSDENKERSMEECINLDFTGVNQYRNSVVMVSIVDNKTWTFSHGSGFFISDTEIATAAHVFEISDGVYGGSILIRMSYQKSNGEEIYSNYYKAQMDRMNIKTDVAVVKIQPDDWVKKTAKPLIPSENVPSYGETLMVCGFPTKNGKIQYASYTDEVYVQKTSFQARDSYNNIYSFDGFETSGTQILRGMSGGPIVNKDGKVVGTTSASSDSNPRASFFIEYQKIQKMYQINSLNKS